MKLSTQQVEVGLERLYKVLWALLAVVWWASLISDHMRHGYDNDRLQALVTAAVIGTVVVPWVFRETTRWIYRGFKPKTE